MGTEWLKNLQGVKRCRKFIPVILLVLLNSQTNSAYAATTYGFFLKICGQPSESCYMYLMGVVDNDYAYRDLVNRRITNWSKKNNYNVPLGAYTT